VKVSPVDTLAIMLADAGADVKPEAVPSGAAGAVSNAANTVSKSDREANKEEISLQQIKLNNTVSATVAAEVKENFGESVPAIEEKWKNLFRKTTKIHA
jgi:hypothetical protein